MSAFTLGLVVAIADGTTIRRVPIAVRVPGPVPWTRVEDSVRGAAGLAAGTPLYLGVGRVEADWIVGAPPLLAGVTLSTRPSGELPVAAAITLAVCGGPDAGATVPLDVEGVVVGRAPEADLRIDDPEVSARHAHVSIAATGLRVTDLASTNGVRIDGRPLAPERAEAVRHVADVQPGSLIRLGSSLLTAGLTTEARARATPDGRGHLLVQHIAAPEPGELPDPEPPAPPSTPPRRQLPILTVLISAALGAGLALILGSWVYLAVAAVGPVTMLATALGDTVTGHRRQRRDRSDHERAVADWQRAMRAAALTRREGQWQRYPGPSTLLRRATEVLAGLWSRGREDPRRLCLAIGVDAGARADTGGAADTGGTADTGAGAGAETASAAETPVAVNLAQLGVLGLAGDTGPLLRFLVLQAVCLLAPEDLRLVVFSEDPGLRGWQEVPHALRADGDTGADRRSDLLVVVDDSGRWRSDPSVSALVRAATRTPSPTRRRVLAVCAAQRRADLPAECSALLHLGPRSARAVRLPDADGRPDVTHDGQLVVTGVSEQLVAQAFSALAALTTGGGPTRPPASLGFDDLYGAVDAPTLRSRWAAPTASATIGAAAAGTIEFDLDRDGPHLLVAGTTGAGKSELLRTLVAGLAVVAPPDRMSFLLIDYKGGAAFAALADLPHVTGLITDLDGQLAGRALVSLRAELRRRERLAATGDDPPPRLVIAVDEFAALASDQPGFLAGLVDIAQRGRSLGLHLVLATQRPAGVVSPAIRANIATRICLRVVDPADSLDVVGSTAAADLPPELPGRALFFTGGRDPVEFQTARISAPSDPGVLAWRRDGPKAYGFEQARPVAGPRAVTELDRLVAEVTRAARGRARRAPPWLPPLPTRIDPDAADDDCVAMVDRPDRQCQEPLVLPEGSVLVVGDPRSGRTTALARIAGGAAARGARLIMLDPRGDLTSRWRWPAADTVLDATDPSLIGRVLDLLTEIPPGARREPMLLVIDGWEEVTAAMDAADRGATTARLLRLLDTAPADVRVVASGGRALQHQSASQRVTHLVELGDGHEVTVPGRGRYRGDEIQIVLPPSEPARPGQASEGAAHARVVVRPLPGTLQWTELPRACPAAVPLGRGGDTAGPISLDLTGPGGAWVVAGPRRCGVSTTLLTLGAGATAAGIAVLRVGPATAPEQLRHDLDTHQGPLLLVADVTAGLDPDRGEPRDLVTGPTASRSTIADLLARFCRVCGPGQILALGTRSESLAASFHGPIAEALAFRRAVLLGGEPADGIRLGVRLPRRPGPPLPGRGFLVQDGVAIPLQVALPPQEPTAVEQSSSGSPNCGGSHTRQ